ncbi:MAG: hypothetical protein ACI861_002144 [Paracoccaceae bacterium]|jgi:hypothetical protein
MFSTGYLTGTSEKQIKRIGDKMLGILAKSFKTASREASWSRSDPFMTHHEELRHHEARKREELHRQLAHAKYYRNR